MILFALLKTDTCTDTTKVRTVQAESYSPKSLDTPMMLDHKMPTVMNSWWQVPMAPLIFLGEISAKYNEARLTFRPVHKNKYCNINENYGE